MVQDPLPCNELGCLLFRARSYDAAERWLSRALERVPGRLTEGLPPLVSHSVERSGASDYAAVQSGSSSCALLCAWGILGIFMRRHMCMPGPL